MRVGIHQPHYFPWLGYFDKMSKCDKFVLLDEVQLEKNSQMIRNRVLCEGRVKYLTISADTKGFLEKKYNEIKVKDKIIWTKNQLNALSNYYRNCTFFEETYFFIENYLSNDYLTLCEWTINSIILIMRVMGIETDIVLQSSIPYDRDSKRSELVLSICKTLNADIYVSGNGASANYLQREEFDQSGIAIEFQDYCHPVYPQLKTSVFVPGLSIIDCLFNMGIKKTREILNGYYE